MFPPTVELRTAPWVRADVPVAVRLPYLTTPPYAPPVPGIGFDLLEIERLEAALQRRPRLARRLFTDEELAYARGRARPGQHLAARFCAKEAVAKALGLTGWSFTDVEVVATDAGPEVRLTGAAARRADELGVHEARVSLTHTRSTAGAAAVLVP